MCSYNLINGVYAAENKKYLSDYLRQSFGFKGVIVSDWGAYRSAYKSINATLDLVMPHCDMHFANVKAALEKGLITEDQIDFCAQNMLNLIAKCQAEKRVTTTKEERHENAVKIAEEGIVLLKNEGALPLKQGKICVGGNFADNPPIGGGGSAYVQTDYQQKNLAYLLQEDMGKGSQVEFAHAYLHPIGDTNKTKAVYQCAYWADSVILCVGNDSGIESEGYDRKTIKLSSTQENFIINTAK